MGIQEALDAVAAAIDGNPALRIARRGIREDDTHYLIPVLDTRQVREPGEDSEPSESQLFLIDKASSDIQRVTVADALTRSREMRAVTAS